MCSSFTWGTVSVHYLVPLPWLERPPGACCRVGVHVVVAPRPACASRLSRCGGHHPPVKQWSVLSSPAPRRQDHREHSRSCWVPFWQRLWAPFAWLQAGWARVRGRCTGSVVHPLWSVLYCGRLPEGIAGTAHVTTSVPPPPLVRSPCQENYPADAHPSVLKSVLESANPRMDSECASGCTWSTARATARLRDSRPPE